MDHLEAVEQRPHDAQQHRLVEGRRPTSQRWSGWPVSSVHHHVGGLVGAEIAQHPHDAGLWKLARGPAFEQEALQAALEAAAHVRRRGTSENPPPRDQAAGAYSLIATRQSRWVSWAR